MGPARPEYEISFVTPLVKFKFYDKCNSDNFVVILIVSVIAKVKSLMWGVFMKFVKDSLCVTWGVINPPRSKQFLFWYPEVRRGCNRSNFSRGINLINHPLNTCESQKHLYLVHMASR